MRKLLFLIMLILLSSFVYADTIEVIDFFNAPDRDNGNCFNRNVSYNGMPTSYGGWVRTFGIFKDEFEYNNTGTDYNGDGFYIRSPNDGGNRMEYTNATVLSEFLSFQFYDDATVVDPATYIDAGHFEQIWLGLVGTINITNYICYNGTSFQNSTVERSTGWHEFLFYFNYTDSHIYAYVDNVYCMKRNQAITGLTGAMLHVAPSGYTCLDCKIDDIKFYNGSGNITLSINYSDTAVTGEATDIYLNILSNSTPINTYDATLNYNGTLYYAGTSPNFTETVTAPSVPDNTSIISFYWILELNGVDYTSSSLNQTIINFFLDNCTHYGNTSFYFRTYDEETSDALNTNVSFTFNYYIEGNDEVKTYYTEMKNRNNYRFCQYYDDTVLIGNITAVMSNGEYVTRTFFKYNEYYNGTFNGYLLKDELTSATITFSLYDTSGEVVEGANMQIYRNVNGTNNLIYEQDSDVAGQIVVFLDQQTVYNFIINASGYPIKSFSLQPASTTYTIYLTQTTGAFYDSEYSGIRYKIKYNGVDSSPTVINITNRWENITFEVQGNDLIEIGINFTNHNYTCMPPSCEQIKTVSGAGTVTILFNASHIGTINTEFFFRRSGKERIYVNDGLIKIVPFLFLASHSLENLIEEIKGQFSPNTRTIFLAVVEVVVIGVFSSLGFVGSLLIIPAVGINILGGVTGLINPIVAMIISIFGIVVFVLAQARAY